MKKRSIFIFVAITLMSLSYLQESNATQKIKVGVYNFKPLVFIDDMEKAQGFFPDILEYIAEQEGWEITYVPGSWSECLNRVENGEVDIQVAIAYSAKRAVNLDFSSYLIMDWASVFKHKGSPIQTIFDLQDKTVSVVKSGITTDDFKRVLEQFNISCHIIEKNENMENLQAVHNGEADAGVCPNIYGTTVENDYDIERTPIVFSPIKLGFATKRGQNQQILSTINSYITELKEDKESIYYSFRDKWTTGYSKDVNLPKWILPVILISVCLFLILALFNITLKIRVKTKTEELVAANRELILSEERYRILFEQAKEEITERRAAESENQKLQQQLVQAQKLESIGRLAGGVAHDFNNMLGVIIGHVGIMLDSMESSNPFYQGLLAISNAANRSADLTKQLLAFARKQTVNLQLIDLNDAVEGMLSMLERLIGEDIDLIWIACKDSCKIEIDPSQVDQIMVNLCVNAKDAIFEAVKDDVGKVGRITIETNRVIIDDAYCADHIDAAAGIYLMLAVSDNGCGMEKSSLSIIFDPFFTTKDVDKGTGLGLASVYGIVKQNGGFINVYSEPKEGTTFKIYFPIYDNDKDIIDTQNYSTNSVPLFGEGTILLVEDESWLLELGETMLQRLGYKVLTASTPKEAINIAQTYPEQIDLLLTDVIMPEMNGRELERQLSKIRPALKSIFMSGYTSNVIVHHGVLDEDINFIQKPFSIQELGNKIQEVFNNG